MKMMDIYSPSFDPVRMPHGGAELAQEPRIGSTVYDDMGGVGSGAISMRILSPVSQFETGFVPAVRQPPGCPAVRHRGLWRQPAPPWWRHENRQLACGTGLDDERRRFAVQLGRRRAGGNTRRVTALPRTSPRDWVGLSSGTSQRLRAKGTPDPARGTCRPEQRPSSNKTRPGTVDRQGGFCCVYGALGPGARGPFGTDRVTVTRLPTLRARSARCGCPPG